MNEAILAKLARRAERLANPAPLRQLDDKPLVYRKPKHTKLGLKCGQCGRPKSDYSAWAQPLCLVCYRIAARERLARKMALRELKIRLAKEAGL